MARKRLDNIIRWVLCLTSSCLIGCSSRAGDVAIRAIPGTEQVAIYTFCISVSPGERWLAFTEWVLPKSRVFEDLPSGEYESRIGKLNLETGEITRYTVDSALASDLGFSSGDPGWIGQAGFEVIEQRFRPPGWRGDLFHFQPYYHGIYVALGSHSPGMGIIAMPETPGTCSDCPPMISAQFRDRTWDLLSNDVSAVFHEGAVRAVYYVSSPFQHNQVHHRAIYGIGAVGVERIVVEKEEKKGTLMSIASVRVSPGERYLAYVVHSKKKAFLSGPREELFIRDLASGREKKIAKYGYMGNLIWSPDGDRLYFAGGEYASDSAVRVVDVAATFSR